VGRMNRARKESHKNKTAWISLVILEGGDIEVALFEDRRDAKESLDSVYWALTKEEREKTRYLFTELEIHAKGK